jgi:hypothetical protein
MWALTVGTELHCSSCARRACSARADEVPRQTAPGRAGRPFTGVVRLEPREARGGSVCLVNAGNGWADRVNQIHCPLQSRCVRWSAFPAAVAGRSGKTCQTWQDPPGLASLASGLALRRGAERRVLTLRRVCGAAASRAGLRFPAGERDARVSVGWHPSQFSGTVPVRSAWMMSLHQGTVYLGDRLELTSTVFTQPYALIGSLTLCRQGFIRTSSPGLPAWAW